MKIISTKHPILFKNVDEVYRQHLTMDALRTGTFIQLNGTYASPYDYYELITKSLINGAYKLKVISMDDLDNVNSGVEGTATVSGYALPPKNVAVTLLGSNITLTWSHSVNGAPTNYKVYGNGGSGIVIDRTTVLSTVIGSLLTSTFAVANGEWLLVVESLTSSSESINLDTVSITVPVAATKPPSPGFGGKAKITGLSLTRVSVGKVKVRFYWLYGSSAASFRIYHDDATGTISYVTPKFSFTRQNSYIQEYTTTALHTDDENKQFKFVVRSVTSDSVEDTNTDEYTIEVDGDAPDNATIISTESIF